MIRMTSSANGDKHSARPALVRHGRSSNHVCVFADSGFVC